jgi:hypothetical protein
MGLCIRLYKLPEGMASATRELRRVKSKSIFLMLRPSDRLSSWIGNLQLTSYPTGNHQEITKKSHFTIYSSIFLSYHHRNLIISTWLSTILGPFILGWILMKYGDFFPNPKLGELRTSQDMFVLNKVSQHPSVGYQKSQTDIFDAQIPSQHGLKTVPSS